MSIFKKITILFIIGLGIMLFLSIKTNEIADKKLELFYKESYLKNAKILMDLLVNGDFAALKTKADLFGYEEIEISLDKNGFEISKVKDKISPTNQNLTHFANTRATGAKVGEKFTKIYTHDITFGSVEVIKKDSFFYLHLSYLDDEFIFFDKTQNEALDEKAFLNYAIYADIFLLCAVFLLLIRLLAPLKNLSKGLERFGGGDYSYRLKATGDDEITAVVSKFNDMASNLQDLNTARKRLLADISHELRTPILKAKIAIEMMEESKFSHIIKKSLVDMDELTNEILQLERLNSGSVQLGFEAHKISTVLLEALGRLMIDEDSLKIEISDDFDIVCDKNYLAIGVKNLIDNALKYNDYSISSQIGVKVHDKALYVESFGGELKKPLDFYTQDFTQDCRIKRGFDEIKNDQNSSNLLIENEPKNIGYGLGLALVKRILNMHGFVLSYEFESSCLLGGEVVGKNRFCMRF